MKLNEQFLESNIVTNQSLKIAVFYPNSYFLAMSNLGFQGLFSFLKHEGFNVHRYFFDPKENKLYSPDEKNLLKHYDLVFISQSYENDFINILKAIIQSDIELDKEKRETPKFIIGGAFPSMNQNLYFNLIDFILPGELEQHHSTMLNICDSFPDIKSVSIKAQRSATELSLPQYSRILTPDTSFPDTFLLEITRGCRFNCSFCTVPDLFGTLRSYPKEILYQLIEKGLEATKKIGLVSALTTDHPDLKDIIHFINDRGGDAGFSSLRIEQIDYEFLELIQMNHQNILTIAPEVASAKLKKKIKKNIKIDSLLKLMENAHKLKFKKIKLYFIIGFQEEDESDLESIVDMVKAIRKISLTYAKENKFMPELILSVNQFIPKPLTPLAQEPFEDQKVISKKLQYLRKHLLSIGNISIRTDNSVENYLQWKISHGNEKLYKFLAGCVKENPSITQKDIYKKLKKGDKSNKNKFYEI